MSEKKNIKTRQVVTAHPSSLKHSNSNLEENSGLWAKITRNWPISLASLLSISWITFCVMISDSSEFVLRDSTLIEISTVLSGAFLPLIMIWIFALVLIRINPLAENQHALEKGLDQLLGPVEITQNRVVKIIEQLNTEIIKIDQAADIAVDRFKNLETNFQNQVSELFKATAEADNKSSELTEKLSSEREAISILANEIDEHTGKITEKYQQYKDDVVNINEANKKHSEDLNNEMSFQNKTLENRSKQIEEKLESLATRLNQITDDISDKTDHSYHNLSEIINEFDERKAVLNNFMTLMMDEVSIICEKLEEQATTVSGLTSQSSKDSEKISETINKQSQELSKIAEKAMHDLTSSGAAIEDQAKSMGQSIEDATEQGKISIAKASDIFAEKTNDLNRVSSGLEANIKQSFNEITDTITNKATSLGEDISIQFQSIEADLDRGNTVIEGMLCTNIEGLNSLLKQNQVDTQNLLNDVISTIEGQSEHIEKSLSDTRINMIDKATLIQEEYQTLETFADRFQNKMTETEAEIKKQHNNMLMCVTAIEDGLEVAVDKLKKNSTSLGSHGQKVIETIISQTSDLTSQIGELQNRSKNSILEIQQASNKANENILAKDKNTTEVINEWLEAANGIASKHSGSMKKIETLVTQLVSLEKASEKSLSSSDENIKRISNELLRSSDKIHIASNSAIEAVEETNQALEKNSEKYQQMINAIQLSSQSLAINANAIENKFKKINSDNFSDIATKIMEKLHSGSIDIHTYLEGEIPKDIWDKYISGDKNIFLRKIRKHIGKKPIAEINANYRNDANFRNNVDGFIQIFEELLDTFTETTQDVYSETLLSSDIGKVYFALAEATGRLKT
ncbi:MAG: hypothetical protein HOM01_05750 [Kordiimonadaceae bacterium]|jgi:hypothetical protein|nr:hypothetical protein [Kordiimonadaceae bacterium]